MQCFALKIVTNLKPKDNDRTKEPGVLGSANISYFFKIIIVPRYRIPINFRTTYWMCHRNTNSFNQINNIFLMQYTAHVHFLLFLQNANYFRPLNFVNIEAVFFKTQQTARWKRFRTEIEQALHELNLRPTTSLSFLSHIVILPCFLVLTYEQRMAE